MEEHTRAAKSGMCHCLDCKDNNFLKPEKKLSLFIVEDSLIFFPLVRREHSQNEMAMGWIFATDRER